jgi:hypothetical protein
MRMPTKKGNLLDIPIFVGMFFVLIFAFIIIAFAVTSFFDATENSTLMNNTLSQKVIGESDETFGMLDNLLVFFLVAFSLTTVILAFQIRTHPILFVGAFFMLLITIGSSALFSNIFESIFATGPLSTASDLYVNGSFIMSHLPSFVMYLGGLVILALFIKKRFGDDQ